MQKLQYLTLVHFVEQQLEGWKFERSHWPLHVTLVPWFKVSDEEAVIRSLEKLGERTGTFTLHVGGIEHFGRNRDVPVNIITNPEPARVLHEDLIMTLGKADIAYDEQQYINRNYAPHITRHERDGRHSNKGEEIYVDDFHLVRLLDDSTCLVEKQFNLVRR
jgi:2'-5' RNA ligase